MSLVATWHRSWARITMRSPIGVYGFYIAQEGFRLRTGTAPNGRKTLGEVVAVW